VSPATLEAALDVLVTEAIYGVSANGQTYVADRARTDGKTVEVQFQPLKVEDVPATGWGTPAALYRYALRLRTSAGTRADHRRMHNELRARMHGRRAPAVAGLEVTTLGDVTYEQDGVGDTTAPLSSWVEITFKGDVLQGELAANG
jgi:hypothetical protein